MKLRTNSSIHTCQARLFRGDGAFLFGGVALGDSFISGVGVVPGALGDGVATTGSGLGDACTAMIGMVALIVRLGRGANLESAFLIQRVQTPKARAAASTMSAQTITGLFRVGPDL